MIIALRTPMLRVETITRTGWRSCFSTRFEPGRERQINRLGSMKSALYVLGIATICGGVASGADSFDGPDLSRHIRQNFSVRAEGSAEVFSKSANGVGVTRNTN